MKPTDKRYPTPWRVHRDETWILRYLICADNDLIIAHGMPKRVAQMIVAAMNERAADTIKAAGDKRAADTIMEHMNAPPGPAFVVSCDPRGGRTAFPTFYDVSVRGSAVLEDGPVAKVYVNDYRTRGVNPVRAQLMVAIAEAVRETFAALERAS